MNSSNLIPDNKSLPQPILSDSSPPFSHPCPLYSQAEQIDVDDDPLALSEDIPQLDGQDDSLLHNQVNTGQAFSVPNTTNVRHAPYQLNQKKQVSKLKHDSLLTDFEIVVSPTAQSVSVICSTGFYTLVAIPALVNTRVGTTQQVAGFTMYCYDITGKIDDIGAAINAVIFFRLTNNTDRSSAGQVAIHLHHTVRKVQIQGSSMITRDRRASVWFVENFLLDKFKVESQNKSFDIARLNTEVRDVVNKHVEKINAKEKCEVCSVHFIGRSLREYCQGCDKTFHKKCVQSSSHPCSGGTPAPGPTPASLPQSSVAPATTQTMVLSAACSSAQREVSGDNPSRAPVLTAVTTVTTSLASSTSANTSPLGAPPVTTSRRAVLYVPPPSGPTSTTTVPTNTTILNPSCSPFQPHPSTSGTQNRGEKGKSKPKPGTPTTKEDVALEFSKVEINTVRARLKVLETKNKDLEFQNKLLLERIAILEKAEKENIYEKYFPLPGSQSVKEQNPPASAASPSHCPWHHSCCRRVYCCQTAHDHHDNPSRSQDTPAASTNDLILKRISEIQINVEELNIRLNNIESLNKLSNKKHGTDKHGKEDIDNVESENEVIPVEENQISDDSIVTVDENVEDLSDSVQNYLNSTGLTSQLRKLRH